MVTKSLPALPARCPVCSGPVEPGPCHGEVDKTMCGWRCVRCVTNSFDKHDHPEITIGRKIAPQFKDISALDGKITTLPINIQLGILRENQT